VEKQEGGETVADPPALLSQEQYDSKGTYRVNCFKAVAAKILFLFRFNVI